jgi:hypothetical protein
MPPVQLLRSVAFARLAAMSGIFDNHALYTTATYFQSRLLAIILLTILPQSGSMR